jgi:hypothetical protein
MVVDHASGLHVCVNNRRPDEFETSQQQVFTQAI